MSTESASEVAPALDPQGEQRSRDIERLLSIVEAQQSQIDELRRRLGATARSASPVGEVGSDTSRRRLLSQAGRLGAVAAGAGIAASIASKPVAADDGDPVVIGQTNFGQSDTIIETDGTDIDAFVSRDGPIVEASGVRAFRSALGGHAVGDVLFNGVHAFASDNTPPGGDIGTGHPLIAQAGPNARSSMLLTPTAPDPTSAGIAHGRGELVSDTDGDLWFCVASGTPGAFRRLAGTDTAGSFVAIDPIRVYDSRFDADGRIFSGFDRVVDVHDAHDPTTYAITQTDAVELGSSAVAYNLTVVNTIATGFLSIAPAGQTGVQASSINWADSTSPGPIANGSQVALAGDRQVRVSCGGGGSCNFVLDVVGVYR